MRAWLKSQLKHVEEIADHPEPDQQHFDQLRDIISEAGRRAAQAGLPDCLRATAIRPGPISVAIARRVLTDCLAAIKTDPQAPLTVKEAAARLNISERKVYDLCEKGLLKCTTNPIRILPKDLGAYATSSVKRSTSLRR